METKEKVRLRGSTGHGNVLWTSVHDEVVDILGKDNLRLVAI